MSDDALGFSAQWPAPAWVRTLSTTREGGVSQQGWASLNLGSRCGDDPAHVAENRRRVSALLGATPCWLHQVHGTVVAETGVSQAEVQADACVSRVAGAAAVVLTADCMPLLFCHQRARVVAAAHAGWRGMAAGVIEATIAAMAVDPAGMLVWLGPTIGRDAFEVGDEVRAAFLATDAAAAQAFHPGAPGKWWADLYQLARLRLARAGVTRIHGGDFCTVRDPARFFSHRRDRGITGRMGNFIWMVQDFQSPPV
ncbi:MAG: peptidoglycan editing factor PgeF [Burkholderiales bacterium]